MESMPEPTVRRTGGPTAPMEPRARRGKGPGHGPLLTTRQGHPVYDNQNNRTVGERGPTVLENYHFLEKISHFDRERIPERVVHARGAGAHGYFETYGTVGDEPISKYTRAKLFQEQGKRTPLFVRFSTVIHGGHSPETLRDPRGFAIKMYTEDGNWDLVGNNLQIFFIRDAMKFPDVVHAFKPDPVTNRQDPNRIFDFVSLSPSAMHMITWLFSPWGIPQDYRHMRGSGVHAYKWVNDEGHAVLVKYHWITQQGDAEPDPGAGPGDPGERTSTTPPRTCTTPSRGATSRSGSFRSRSWRTASTRSSTSTRWTRPRSGRRSCSRCAGRHDGAGPQPGELLRRGRAGRLRDRRAGGWPRLLGRQAAPGPDASPTPIPSATGSARTTCSCRSTPRATQVNTNQRDGQMTYHVDSVEHGANPHVNYEPTSRGGPQEVRPTGASRTSRWSRARSCAQEISRTNNYGQAGERYRAFERGSATS